MAHTPSPALAGGLGLGLLGRADLVNSSSSVAQPACLPRRPERVAQSVAGLAHHAVEVLGVDSERSVLAHGCSSCAAVLRGRTRRYVTTSVRSAAKFATTSRRRPVVDDGSCPTTTRRRATTCWPSSNALPRRPRAHDRDGWVGLFTADGVVEDPVGSRPHRGRAEIERFYDTFIGPRDITFHRDADVVVGLDRRPRPGTRGDDGPRTW